MSNEATCSPRAHSRSVSTMRAETSGPRPLYSMSDGTFRICGPERAVLSRAVRPAAQLLCFWAASVHRRALMLVSICAFDPRRHK
jgi:hypothetical protein